MPRFVSRSPRAPSADSDQVAQARYFLHVEVGGIPKPSVQVRPPQHEPAAFAHPAPAPRQQRPPTHSPLQHSSDFVHCTSVPLQHFFSAVHLPSQHSRSSSHASPPLPQQNPTGEPSVRQLEEQQSSERAQAVPFFTHAHFAPSHVPKQQAADAPHAAPVSPQHAESPSFFRQPHFPSVQSPERQSVPS